MSNEEKWLRAVADGRREAMEALFEAFKPKIFRYVLSLLRNYHAAEDVTQDVFLKIFRFADQFTGASSAATWMFAIARRAALDWQRRNAMEEPYMEPPFPEPAAPPPDTGFVELLSLLDKRSRDVVALHLAGGLKYREIAALTGETESAVRQRYSRALKHLKRVLKGG